MPKELFSKPLFSYDGLRGGGGRKGDDEFSETVVGYAEGAIQNMRGRAIPLVRQLTPFINQGIYHLIVSDDVKGHVPAQLLHLVIYSMYYSSGFPHIDLVHIRGRGRTIKEEMVSAFQDQAGILDILGQKILLVTESIGSGKTISRFGQAFRALDIPYDIASFVVSEKEERYRRWGQIGEDVRLFHPDMPDGSEEFVDQCQLMSAAFYPERSFNDFEMAIGRYTQTRLPTVAKEVLAEVI